MKPGNRHENEMVPNHTKRKLWKMREWFANYCVYPSALFLSRGVFILEWECIQNDSTTKLNENF